MCNYNTGTTAYASFREMVKGVAGEWYFMSDPDAGFEALVSDIDNDDFTSPLEFFEGWNADHPSEQVTADDIKDVARELAEWYYENCIATE